MPPYTLAIMPAPDPKPAPAKLTLYELEDAITCLVNSTELVQAEQEAEFLAELERAMVAAKDKRDHAAAFIVQCETQAAMAKTEQVRLRKRQAFFEAATARMESYVLGVLMHQAPDAKGRYPKLVGNTSSFEAKRNPPSVSITNEESVPPEFKEITVTLPLPFWESVLDSLDMDLCSGLLTQITSQTIACQKATLKPALQAGPVEGAHLVTDKYHLVRS